MNGIAIVLDGCDFSQNNLGKVTFVTSEPLVSIDINSQASYIGETVQLSVSYTPSSTNQKGITWSVTSGQQYASIDASTGLMTILPGASSNQVTIKATSTANASITSSKSITVTHNVVNTDLQSLTINGLSSVTGLTSTYSVSYTPSNTPQTGVAWSIMTGSQYATIDSSTGVLTINSIASSSLVTIKATSSVNASISATKDVTVTYQQSAIDLQSIAVSGSQTLVGVSSQYSAVYTPSDTSYKGVTWSIASGSQYGTIDSNTGILTLNNTASASQIIIKATSTHNTSIFGQLTVTASYLVATSINMRNRVAYCPLPACGADATIFLEAEAPIAIENSSVALQLVSGSTTGYLEAMDSFCIAQKYSGNDIVQAAISKNGSETTSGSKLQATMYSQGSKITTLLLNSTKALLNGSDKVMSDYAIPYVPHNGYMCINTTAPSKTVPVNLLQYTTNESLQQAVTSGIISPAHTTVDFKIKNLIIFKNTRYNTAEEVIANRASADIDIKLIDGVLSNAGSSGTLIYTT